MNARHRRLVVAFPPVFSPSSFVSWAARTSNHLPRARSRISFFPVSSSRELPGLTASLDKLCYHHGGVSLPADKPHAFVYFVTIRNRSDRAVTLLGRKWVVIHGDGTRLVIEGDKIVGETPHLAPGEQFSYNSYHVTGLDAWAHGSFHGIDELGNKIHVILPAFEMNIPRG
jgi:ApaG protein